MRFRMWAIEWEYCDCLGVRVEDDIAEVNKFVAFLKRKGIKATVWEM